MSLVSKPILSLSQTGIQKDSWLRIISTIWASIEPLCCVTSVDCEGF